MTLRTKTRSRKGRDLKRLDGVRHRVTRRRQRQQRQRGGAERDDDVKHSYNEWISAVNATEIYKSPIDPGREDYSLSIIEQSSNTHKLPPFDGENMNLFEIPNYGDVRSLSASVVDMLKLIMNSTNTIGEFKEQMEKQKNPGEDTLASADIQARLQVLANIENAIRSSGESAETESTNELNDSGMSRQISASTDILTDVSKYPLYLWALYYSAPTGSSDNSVPILTPPEKVASETGSEPITPSAPANIAL
jgi:hypothetical protein